MMGNTVTMADHSFELARHYKPINGSTEIGIRPEFISITDAATAGAIGVPLQVNAIENIGRHKIVRGSINGQRIDAVIQEDANVPAEPYAVIDTKRLNVYENSHLVRGIQ
ncbi:MAG: glycerol transport system ATP-binding protein [Porticoccaceae bacterium]